MIVSKTDCCQSGNGKIEHGYGVVQVGLFKESLLRYKVGISRIFENILVLELNFDKNPPKDTS